MRSEAPPRRVRLALSRWRPSGERRASAGLRLFLALALTLLLVLAVNYAVVRRQLEHGLIEATASEQQATAASFARHARLSGPRALREMQDLVDALAARPGTLEAIVIGPNFRIVAAGNRRQLGLVDRNVRVEAALLRGRPFGGYEPRPTGGHQFEFITPIVLGGMRYALEVTHDDTLFAAQLAHLRRVTALLGVLALALGAAAFWLAGGRAVLRSHRLALARATQDGLTDLGNHRAFQDELERAVGLARRSGEPLALLSLDLDSFKRANDTHGHAYGDDILRRTADVLRQGRVGDRAFRIGGDEFAVILPQTTAADACRYAERVRGSLQQAGVAASVGLSDLRTGQDEPETLRQEADAALYEAKRRSGGAPVSFEEIREFVSVASPEKLRAVHRLVSEGDLAIVLQPIWDLQADAVLGFEALARPAAHYGFSGPAEAFDLALQSGCVHALDELCVRKALACATELDSDTLLFVNVTPQTLDIDGGRDDWIRQAAETAGIAPARIVVEVTERPAARSAGLVGALRQLRSAGFKLALDDAGTGSSGLEMLREVPFDFVKIDRSVVAAALSESRARGIFLALASYARETGAVAIAEGIEDAETLSFVQNATEGPLELHAGIQGGQGFLLGVPASSPRLPTVA